VGYLYIFPAYVFFVIFVLYPIVYGIIASFRDWGSRVGERGIFVGFSNYVKLFSDYVFWLSFRNTWIYVFVATVITCCLGLFLALLLERPLRGLQSMRGIIFFPYLLPWAAVAMIWAWLLSPNYGLINAILNINIDWLRRPETALWALIFIYSWKMIGYTFIFFLAGLQVIPQSLHEAAIVDGASPLQRLLHITFPLLTPTLFFLILISITTALQSIDLVYILTRGGPANSTNMLIYYIYQQTFRYGNWNKGYAANSILLFMLLCFTIAYFKILERKVHYELI